MEPIDHEQVRTATQPDGWAIEDGELRITFATGSFVKGVELIERIAAAAEAAAHHPDVFLTYPRVELTLVSHEVGALTSADVDLALQISEIARGMDVAVGQG